MGPEKQVNQEWRIERTDGQQGFSPRGLVCAAWQLTWGKPVWTWQTLVVLILLGLACCIVAAHSWLHGEWLVEDFLAEVLIPAYLGFLLPICCLSSGAQVLGGAWEEGWLTWLILRPVPRSLIFLLLLGAAIPWTLLLTLGGVVVLAALAGTNALRVTISVLGPLALGSLAYLTLFVLLSVLFRRATLLSIAYVFVVENFLGYMPGLISRVSINFHVRSLIAAAGWPASTGPQNVFPFEATCASVAWSALGLITLTSIVLGAIFFARREYGDPNT